MTEPSYARQPFTVCVRIYKLATGNEEQSHLIDYNDPNKRGWLQKLCVWAWHNGHSVEMFNADDKKLADSGE